MNDVFILGAQRTPIGSFLGALADRSAPELGARAIEAATVDAGVEPDAIDEVLMGCVIGAGVRQAPARQAMRLAGVPDAVGATTVNKVCASGMKCAMLGADLIRAGSANYVVAGGMESMSNAPYLLAKARRGQRMGHGEISDSMFTDGLEDADTGASMGSFAQTTADAHQITREEMDAFAIASVTKALRAMDGGDLECEIAPFDDVREDEQPRRSRIDRIPTLRPAFARDGTITAANASSISDGASALVLGDASAGGETPLARVVGHATHSIHPSNFTIAPVGAIDKLLSQVGWSTDDVDLFEINEAFAMVTMLAIAELGLDPDRVNLYGGLRPGTSHRIDRQPTARHAGARPQGDRRKEGRRGVVHRRRRGDRDGDRAGVIAHACLYNRGIPEPGTEPGYCTKPPVKWMNVLQFQ